ncbi:hypothetical protein Tco_1114450 [Tanacetum coccineum]|uniref:Uncharacterized protein n=1 Tax=Tanacetum coccineum TaxID=301880 RepID=A0ABQ5IXD0_9ASTR
MDSIITLGQKNTLAEYMILSGADNRPPMLDKDLYDLWKSRMELYAQNREHGRMILESVENVDCDIKATNIILQGLLVDIYSLMNHHRVAKDLWERVQLLMQGYLIWEVIKKGNGPVSVSTYTNGVIKVLPPKTVKEILAREKERKARSTLLMALPEDHLAKFHKMTDAKEMWDAIKSRFCEGLHKGYDRFQSLLSQLEIHGAGVSAEDANQKFLRVFESDVKGSTGSSSKEMVLKWQLAMISMRLKKFYKKTSRRLQFEAKEPVGFDKTKTGHAEDEQENFALMAYNNSGSDTKVKSCSKECVESYAKLKKLYDEQREQLGDASIEIQAYTQALEKVEAQLVTHQKNQLWYEENIKFMNIDLDDKTDVSTRDKSGLGYGDQVHNGVLSYENKVFQSVFDSRSSDVEDSPVHDRFENVEGMHALPPPMIGNYMPSGPDREVDDSTFTYGPK